MSSKSDPTGRTIRSVPLLSPEITAQNARFGFNQPQLGTTLNQGDDDPERPATAARARSAAEKRARQTAESVLLFLLVVGVLLMATMCGGPVPS